MSELFKKVGMTKVEEAAFRSGVQSGKTEMNTKWIEAVKDEIKRQLDQRIIDQSKEIGLRNSLRRK